MVERAASTPADPTSWPAHTAQRWAYDYITAPTIEGKLAPRTLPEQWLEGLPSLRVAQPSRPAPLRISPVKLKAPRAGALANPRKRAELFHTFLHHELQAAELMCWAVLAFPDTPLAFRRGLLAICHDEIRHMRMYAEHMATLGSAIGDFAVRDWFWSRVPAVQSAASYCAVMGLGFEAGNLDHTQRFAARFRAVGDARGAELQEHVAQEEVPHVAFAAHWFQKLQGALSFAAWQAALPEPLSPMVMRGDPLDREARAKAGLDAAFLDALQAWQPVLRGS